MAVFIRIRCLQGTLVITDQSIWIERGRLKQQSLARSSLTGIDSTVSIPPLLGYGGATDLVFHGQGGERLEASMMTTSKAQEVKSLLG